MLVSHFKRKYYFNGFRRPQSGIDATCLSILSFLYFIFIFFQEKRMHDPATLHGYVTTSLTRPTPPSLEFEDQIVFSSFLPKITLHFIFMRFSAPHMHHALLTICGILLNPRRACMQQGMPGLCAMNAWPQYVKMPVFLVSIYMAVRRCMLPVGFSFQACGLIQNTLSSLEANTSTGDGIGISLIMVVHFLWSTSDR